MSLAMHEELSTSPSSLPSPSETSGSLTLPPTEMNLSQYEAELNFIKKILNINLLLGLRGAQGKRAHLRAGCGLLTGGWLCLSNDIGV